MLKIEGLGKLEKQLKDAQRAFSSLNGTITSLSFDPEDPRSVQDAIRKMETAIDRKAAPYRNNSLVSGVVSEMKASYRKEILARCQKKQK
jgi:thiamine biosynthesis lipoprotein ApbE